MYPLSGGIKTLFANSVPYGAIAVIYLYIASPALQVNVVRRAIPFPAEAYSLDAYA